MSLERHLVPRGDYATFDHLKPRSRGGGHKENVILACFDCNTKRGNGWPPVTAKQIEAIDKLVALEFATGCWEIVESE